MITMSQTMIIQSVNANTSAKAASIRSEILLAAQNIIGTIKAESATIVLPIIALKEGTTGKEMTDMYTRMIGAQQ